jgi:ELWxxDGT repeat protein
VNNSGALFSEPAFCRCRDTDLVARPAFSGLDGEEPFAVPDAVPVKEEVWQMTWLRRWRGGKQRATTRRERRRLTCTPRTEWLEDRTVFSSTQPGLPTLNSPGSITSVGAKTYFFALDGDHGEALWSSNGTAAGAQVVKDITPTLPDNVSEPVFLGSANLANLTSVGDSLFFTALNLGRPQIWKSDGTPAGTELVKTFAGLVVPGDPSTSVAFGIQDLTAAGATAVFRAYDPLHGRQLWLTDGTAAGTQPIPDTSSSSGRQFADAVAALFAGEHPALSPAPSASSGGFVATANTSVGLFPAPPPGFAVGHGPDGPFVLEISGDTGAEPHHLLPAAAPSIEGPTNGTAVIQAMEGVTFTGQVATLTTSAHVRIQAHYRAWIDWGDGSAVTTGSVHVQGSAVEVDGQHTYRQQGSFPVRVQVERDGTPVGELGGTATVVPASRANKDTAGKPDPNSGPVPAPDRSAGLTVAAAFLLPFFWEVYDREERETT